MQEWVEGRDLNDSATKGVDGSDRRSDLPSSRAQTRDPHNSTGYAGALPLSPTSNMPICLTASIRWSIVDGDDRVGAPGLIRRGSSVDTATV